MEGWQTKAGSEGAVPQLCSWTGAWMNPDQFKTDVVDRLMDWLNVPVVVEFNTGLFRVSGLWVLVAVSEAQLQFVLDGPSYAQCDFRIHFDDVIAGLSFAGFEEAAAKILGKRREQLVPEQQSLFATKPVEQVADIRFRSGGRVLLDFVKHDWVPAAISRA